MEEKKYIKISVGTFICIIIIILLLILLGITYYFGFIKKDQNNQSNNIEQSTNIVNTNNVTNTEKAENTIGNETTENKTKKINKLDESKDIVYTLYSKNDNAINVPYINIDSPDVKRINDEIEDYYKPRIDGDPMEFGYPHNVKYYSYINDNILSLVIEVITDNGINEYKVYNLDIYDGTVVTNTDILKLKKLTESEFLTKLKELYQNKFISLYGSKEEWAEKSMAPWQDKNNINYSQIYEEYELQLKNTIDPRNYSIDTPIYLNENGKISIVANIFSMAGANTYRHIIDTDI